MDADEKKPPEGGVEVAQHVSIRCDTQPLFSFVAVLQHFLQRREGIIGLGNLPDELAFVECDAGAARAGEVTATVYPSDAFLRYAGAIFTRDSDQGVIEHVGHG